MANTFDTKSFMTGKYLAPLTYGKHTVQIQSAKFVENITADGRDASYLQVVLKFEDRDVTTNFFGLSIKILLDQIRLSTADDKAYNNPMAFIKAHLKQDLDCWYSRREYYKNDGTVGSQMQFDFVEPKEVTATTETTDGPF